MTMTVMMMMKIKMMTMMMTLIKIKMMTMMIMMIMMMSALMSSHLTNRSTLVMMQGTPAMVICESLGPTPRSTPDIVTLVPPSAGPDSGDT